MEWVGGGLFMGRGGGCGGSDGEGYWGTGEVVAGERGEGGGAFGVAVMTEQQVEVLRKQISAYATICEQLVEMHRTVASHQDSVAGLRLGNLYCDPFLASGSSNFTTTRPRWNPTPTQLKVLESILSQGAENPSKEKVKEIAYELARYGKISAENVSNWFQNRRARLKRKKISASSENAESGTKTDVRHVQRKRDKGKKVHIHVNPHSSEVNQAFQNVEIISQAQCTSTEANRAQSIFSSYDDTKHSESMADTSFYDGLLSNPRIDQLMENHEGLKFSSIGDSYGMII